MRRTARVTGTAAPQGAAAGNTVGAQAGLKGIPEKYTDQPEVKELIPEAADDPRRG